MKKVISVFSALFILLSMAFAVTVNAANPIEPDRPASLTVQYTFKDTNFADLEINTYRIAEVFEDGTYALCDGFDHLQINIYGITEQSEWKAIAYTLASYIDADHIAPTYSATTDKDGCAVFENIKTGMYLTTEKKVVNGEEHITFENFITAVPSPSDEGEHLYDIKAFPKYSSYTPSKNEVEYKLIKQWKDTGVADLRPQTVTVDILKDGELHSSVTLSPENNWSYFWKATDDGSVWQAVERNISKDYLVTVEKAGYTFTVTNTCTQAPENAPQTGNTASYMPYLIIMSFSGLCIVLVALILKRKAR